MKRFILKIAVKILMARGYSAYFAPKVFKHFIEDILKIKGLSIKQKLWAYKRGFLSEKINWYGLNEDNYIKYMPDFFYHKLHPINGQYSKWIDDKLTMKYIISPFNEYLPKYYYELHKTYVFRLMDCPDDYSADYLGVTNLLRDQRNLAAKLLDGTCGTGFYKLSYMEDKFFINNKEVSINEFNDFLASLDNYLLTEYIAAHRDIRRIFDITPNTLRVMVIHDDNRHAQITGAFMRFGNSKTGLVDNATAGGICAIVDIHNGAFFNAKRYEGGRLVDSYIHPDTGVQINGVLPFWDAIKDKLIEIGQYIPQVKYMGFDIIITDDGFKIIEINSHQGIGWIQSYYPIMENEQNRRFFNKLFAAQPRKFMKVQNLSQK